MPGQGASLAAMPNSTQSDCDLSEYVFHSERHLSYGLVIQEQNERRQSALLDFSSDFEVSGEDFELPADYRRVTLPTARGNET